MDKNSMRAMGRIKHMFYFGSARPESNARAHLKQRKKHSGLNHIVVMEKSTNKQIIHFG